MKFMDVCIGIQAESPDSIILIRNGIFFVALNKSAVALEELFSLRPICLKEGVCKCVIPVSQIKKYMDLLIYLDYSFKIYSYDKTKITDEKVKLMFEYFGESSLKDIKLKQECENCWYKDRKITNLNDGFEKEFKKIIEEVEHGKGK